MYVCQFSCPQTTLNMQPDIMLMHVRRRYWAGAKLLCNNVCVCVFVCAVSVCNDVKLYF